MILLRSMRQTGQSGQLLPVERLPEVRTSREPLVLWRTWLIAPERRPGGAAVPLLTGLFGFPWRERELDAKCILLDRGGSMPGLAPRPVDRHHRLIPDPDCTCGIYATRDSLEGPAVEVVPRGQPVATGFVELSGHILQTKDLYRAQHARIVGPIRISPGIVPLPASLAGRRPDDIHSIVTEDRHYRTRWFRTSPGQRYEAWYRETARQLSHRYSVQVIGLSTPYRT